MGNAIFRLPQLALAGNMRGNLGGLMPANVGIALSLALLFTMASTSLASSAEPIGNWLPLSEAAAKYQFSQQTVDMILDSGGELTCVGRNSAGTWGIKNRYVGWVYSVSPPRVLTVGHTMFDSDGDPRSAAELSECYFASNRDVLAGADYSLARVEGDMAAHRFGGPNPWSVDPKDDADDRAILALSDSLTGEVALNLPPTDPYDLRKGKQIFLVSAARPFHRNTKGGYEPMVIRCHIQGIREDEQAGPIALEGDSDCGAFRGVSGSLVFQRRAGRDGELFPIALQSQGRYYVDGDGEEVFIGEGVAVLMEPWFFDFPIIMSNQ